MHKKHKYDILVILALLGFSVSLFLTLSKYIGITVPCGLTGGCEAVLSSRYSIILGIPLSVLGMMYFFGVIFFCLLANHYEKARKILTFFLGLGAVMGMLFLAQQFFLIKKICQYCLLTDFLSVFIFLLDLNIEHKTAKTQFGT